ncbi:MAG: hypothetical protein OHK0029_08850 [Armatimonadaceae bacterium]
MWQIITGEAENSIASAGSSKNKWKASKLGEFMLFVSDTENEFCENFNLAGKERDKLLWCAVQEILFSDNK